MFGVPDHANRVIGERWYCTRCECGVTDRRRPKCWVCGSREHMVPGHKYHAPTSAAWVTTQERNR